MRIGRSSSVKKVWFCGEEREVLFVGKERKKNLSLTVRMGKGGGGDCSILAHFASPKKEKKGNRWKKREREREEKQSR